MQSQDIQDWTPKSGLDVLLLLLYAPEFGVNCNPIAGITRLDKLMFILSKTKEFSNLFHEDYEFIPYNFGPFATELLDDLEALIAEEVVHRNKIKDGGDSSSTRDAEIIDEETGELPENEVSWDMYSFDSYSLTAFGKEVSEKLFNDASIEQQQKVIQVKESYNSLKLSSLLRFVYESFPDYVIKSVIRDEVLRK